MSLISTVSDESIKRAAERLKSGGLVAMPTETVYGLAANALDGRAVARVFEAKGRPQFNPLITHYAELSELKRDAVWNDLAEALAQAFWPGPLTLVLPRREDARISELATAGLTTMAVRMPAHRAAQDLIRAAGVPVVAPSANASGTISPTAPAHVADSLGAALDPARDMILAAGPCKVGIESTVVDLSGPQAVILRPGTVTAEEISRVLERDVTYAADSTDAPKSPGQMLRHYAPSIPLRLNAIDLEPGEALLAFGPVKFMGIKGGGAASDLPEDMIRNLSEERDLHEVAANLFVMLRALDQPGHKGIAAMSIPAQGLGIALNDRLKRAAATG